MAVRGAEGRGVGRAWAAVLSAVAPWEPREGLCELCLLSAAATQVESICWKCNTVFVPAVYPKHHFNMASTLQLMKGALYLLFFRTKSEKSSQFGFENLIKRVVEKTD